jgi:hypothetical protein
MTQAPQGAFFFWGGWVKHRGSFGSDCFSSEAHTLIFDAFSSREPTSTSLENALLPAEGRHQ